ncbi:hypothetical protein ACH4UY_28660 [Streptomyces longwoodensis]|uniref:hypothetical protein n=1 Tax=Streptomyces longwoodensis TaxID=68231 RepID=UPI00378AB83C
MYEHQPEVTGAQMQRLCHLARTMITDAMNSLIAGSSRATGCPSPWRIVSQAADREWRRSGDVGQRALAACPMPAGIAARPRVPPAVIPILAPKTLFIWKTTRS